MERALRGLGHLYPSGGLCEHELYAMAPDGVSVMTTRMPFTGTSVEDNVSLLAQLEQHSRLVADARVELIAVNCTAATLLAGPQAVNDRVRAATGTDSTTTIEAVVAALTAAGLRRIALLTPYPDEVEQAERRFLASVGVDVLVSGGPVCGTPFEQGRLHPDTWFAELADMDLTDADGVLLSCAGIRVAHQIGALEAMSGKPVVASNAALMWHCLRRLGVDERPAGFGSLLSGRYDAGQPVASRAGAAVRGESR